jgi:hypothetical protein
VSSGIVLWGLASPYALGNRGIQVKELQRRGDPSVIIALAGNKADLATRRKVDLQEAQEVSHLPLCAVGRE